MSVGTFHSLSQQRGPRVASQTETGDRGLCMNFRSWLRGDKQIASYFCIHRLNGRRVWNDAPARYKRPLLANTTTASVARSKNSNVIFMPGRSLSSSSHAGSSAPEAQSAVTKESDRGKKTNNREFSTRSNRDHSFRERNLKTRVIDGQFPYICIISKLLHSHFFNCLLNQKINLKYTVKKLTELQIKALQLFCRYTV